MGEPWNGKEFVELLCAWYEQHPDVEKPARKRIWEFVKAAALRSLLDEINGTNAANYITIMDVEDYIKEALARGTPVKQPIFYPLVHLDNLIDMHLNGENWTTIESEIKTMIRVLEKQGHCRPPEEDHGVFILTDEEQP